MKQRCSYKNKPQEEWTDEEIVRYMQAKYQREWRQKHKQQAKQTNDNFYLRKFKEERGN